MIRRSENEWIVDLESDGFALMRTASKGQAAEVGVCRRWQRPTDVEPADADSMGSWIRRELNEAGLSVRRAVVSIPRGSIVLKPLTLPGGTELSESELYEMIQLQLARQLTVGLEGTAVDYLPLPGHDGARRVLAGAVPGDRLAYYRGACDAAGIGMVALCLRSSGLTALIAEHGPQESGATLGVCLGHSSAEFVIIEGARTVFARSVDLPGESDRVVPVLAVEAKRTWMTYRGWGDSTPIERVVIAGSGADADALGERCGEALELPWDRVGVPASISIQTPDATDAMPGIEPLLGLALARARRDVMLDFARVRRVPDPGATRRQAVLAAALGVILLGGAGWYLADREVRSARASLEVLKQQRDDARSDYGRYLLEHAQLEHARAWGAADADWAGHVSALVSALPPTDQALLDRITARLDGASVEFRPASRGPREAVTASRALSSSSAGGQYEGGKWNAAARVVLTVEGKQRNREAVEGMRARLLEDSPYRVSTMGPEQESAFKLRLDAPGTLPERDAEGGGS